MALLRSVSVALLIVATAHCGRFFIPEFGWEGALINADFCVDPFVELTRAPTSANRTEFLKNIPTTAANAYKEFVRKEVDLTDADLWKGRDKWAANQSDVVQVNRSLTTKVLKEHCGIAL